MYNDYIKSAVCADVLEKVAYRSKLQMVRKAVDSGVDASLMHKMIGNLRDNAGSMTSAEQRMLDHLDKRSFARVRAARNRIDRLAPDAAQPQDRRRVSSNIESKVRVMLSDADRRVNNVNYGDAYLDRDMRYLKSKAPAFFK